VLLLLNREGVLERKEKIVMVEMFLAKHLRQHQRDGVQWMYNAVMGIASKNQEGCILADSMGLGKTLQVSRMLYSRCAPSILAIDSRCLHFSCLFISPSR